MKRHGIFILLALATTVTVSAQNISEIAQSDPLIITGAIGTQNTYYHSSAGNGSMSPLSNSIYANLDISVYGINMPFSFYYTNNNTSFSYPHFSFNVSPSYKNWTLHLGQRSMPFSNYIYNIPFYGAGLEFNNKKLRFGAFYGRLKKAINEDPTDPTSRSPQYARFGWGFKIGYGNNRNYLDLFLFRAKDRISSIDERWQDRYFPQENIAMGLKGRVSIKRILSFTGNFATSIFTKNRFSEKIDHPSVTKWDKVFDGKYSSLYRFAGDVNANLSLRNFNALVSYRIVQPDYMTLGSNYISNNLHSLGIALNTSLFKNKMAVTGNFSAQEDNLNNRQLYTTRGFVYSASTNFNIANNFSVNAAYNGYLQCQADGTAHVNDTTEIHRVMHGFSLSPNYSIDGKYLGHQIGTSYNFNKNKNKNKFANGVGDVTTHALGVNYSMNVISIETDFNGCYNHQTSKSPDSKFTTDVFSLGASKSLLKDRNLNLSCNMSYSINRMDGQRTRSFGGDLSAGLVVKEAHNLALSATVNKYNDYYMVENLSYSGLDYSISFNYTFSFTLLELKKKAKKQ